MGSIGTFTVFAIGLWPRITGVLAWLLIVSLLANPVTLAEPDQLLAIFSFLLMLGYLLLGQWHSRPSWLGRVFGPARVWPLERASSAGVPDEKAPRSYAANLTVRLLQVHFAVVVLTSGLHKLQPGDWWSGVAFWYPLHPPFETTPQSIQVEAAYANSTLFMLSLAQYIYLGWELAFPFFAWWKRWRPLLLGGAALGWIGALALYDAPLFGPVYLFGCLTYLTPQEWGWLVEKLRQAARLARGQRQITQHRPRGQQAIA